MAQFTKSERDAFAVIDHMLASAVSAVNPANAVRRRLQRDGRSLFIDDQQYSLEPAGHVFLVAVGKAAVPMALAAIRRLGDLLSSAILVAKQTDRDWEAELAEADLAIPRDAIRLHLAGHPIPDDASVAAGAEVLASLQETTAADLVLCLISGGASALLAQPIVPLNAWQQLTDALLASGCTINELNCVRRQLDEVKGGGMAFAADPATCVSLILSDVIGNPLADIGSGPTVPTTDTPADALEILKQYEIADRLETAVWQQVQEALETADTVTPSPPAHNRHIIIGDVRQAATAAMTSAAQKGFLAQVLTARLQGEAREVARVVAAIAQDASPGHCFVLGGETTVTLHGDGRGGRNQELALAAAVALDGWNGGIVAAWASDGEDGPTDAAGAVVTGRTITLARDHGLDPVAYLDNNDSYTFFQKMDTALAETADQAPHHLLKPGPTGTNVNDLLIILTYPDPETSQDHNLPAN